MKEERYFYVPDASQVGELPHDEAQHATRVLRLKEGDEIYLIDGCGCFFKAQVTLASAKRCTYTIMETLPHSREWQGHLHIAMAPTKMMERTEWMAEKATELGIDEFSFLDCQFSERHHLRTDRIDKIVVAAMKQSHKAWKPVVNPLQSFRSFIEQPREGLKFICHCYNEIERVDFYETLRGATPTKSSESITVLIGPEGDFSIDEVRLAMSHGYQSVSLGSARLRTETAALSSVMIMQLAQRL